LRGSAATDLYARPTLPSGTADGRAWMPTLIKTKVADPSQSAPSGF
jgi:hypothetical protein